MTVSHHRHHHRQSLQPFIIVVVTCLSKQLALWALWHSISFSDLLFFLDPLLLVPYFSGGSKKRRLKIARGLFSTTFSAAFSTKERTLFLALKIALKRAHTIFSAFFYLENIKRVEVSNFKILDPLLVVLLKKASPLPLQRVHKKSGGGRSGFWPVNLRSERECVCSWKRLVDFTDCIARWN